MTIKHELVKSPENVSDGNNQSEMCNIYLRRTISQLAKVGQTFQMLEMLSSVTQPSSPLSCSAESHRASRRLYLWTLEGGQEEVITRPPEQHNDRISPHDLHFSKQINIFTGFSKWFNHDLGYLPPTRPPTNHHHTHTHNPDVLKITKCPYCITLCLSNKDYRFCLYN